MALKLRNAGWLRWLDKFEDNMGDEDHDYSLQEMQDMYRAGLRPPTRLEADERLEMAEYEDYYAE